MLTYAVLPHDMTAQTIWDILQPTTRPRINIFLRFRLDELYLLLLFFSKVLLLFVCCSFVFCVCAQSVLSCCMYKRQNSSKNKQRQTTLDTQLNETYSSSSQNLRDNSSWSSGRLDVLYLCCFSRRCFFVVVCCSFVCFVFAQSI